MPLQAHLGPLGEVTADWLIVGVWQDEPLSPALQQLDARLAGKLARLLERKDITGKANELTPLLDVTGIAARRLLVVGLGKRSEASSSTLHDAAACAALSVTGKALDTLALALPEGTGLGWNGLAWCCGTGLLQGCQGPGIRKNKPARFAPRVCVLAAPEDAPSAEVQAGTRHADMVGRAVSLTRELVNLPPNELYPETFAERARLTAAEVGLACEIWDEPRLREERLNALLGVAQGSPRSPRLVLLRHNGAPGQPTLGLVGKGVTFDSGGLSLKSTEHMLDMKCDMAGAATVLGALQAIAEMKVPVNVLGVLALVENMPSGTALKLGDVLRARSGKTIEIHNTDAEGRLILADALNVAVEQKAAHLVDLATLTGACVVALGTEVTGVMSNNDAWSELVLQAGKCAGEKLWPLPMYPHYTEMIKSSVADIKNTGGSRYGGAITAAKFLQEFVGETPWVHLDIAGPAWAEHENATQDAGGTGACVRTLIELARQYGAAH